MTTSYRFTARRALSSVLAVAMLTEAVAPAYAFVNQLPGIYTTPPEVNVMFTLDDSGSMRSDAIPDYRPDPTNTFWSAVPRDKKSTYGYENSRIAAADVRHYWPNMWGTDIANNASTYLSYDYYKNDDTNAGKVGRYMRSAEGNPLYYNPRVTYLPWPTSANDKVRMNNATTTAVKINVDRPDTTGNTLNITTRRGSNPNYYWPATWYVYKGSTPLAFGSPAAQANNLAANFDRFEITDTSAGFRRYATRTDCTGAVYDPNATKPYELGCTRAQELQNFANWLQYYRNRRLMAKGGVSAAFALQGEGMRVGYGQINTDGTLVRGVERFTGTSRQDFFKLLYTNSSGDGGTPLREALYDVGEYFRKPDPWYDNPPTQSTNEYSCRRSFHILSTDGFWNNGGASGDAANDNDSFLTGDGKDLVSTPPNPRQANKEYKYGDNEPTDPNDALAGRFTVNPFADGLSNTLADVAAYYWRTDLRDTTPNRVVPSQRDPAFWQHVTTFTVGLGISGSGGVQVDKSKVVPANSTTLWQQPFRGQPWLSSQELRDQLIAQKVKVTWTTPNADNAATGDDLIHASMVGRGRYFSASNPSDLANGLAAALAEVADQPLDLAAVATDSPRVTANGRVYQSTFSPSGWYGRLYAFQQASDGSVNNKPTSGSAVNSSQVWEASNKMPAHADRKIYTATRQTTNPVVEFKWDAKNNTSGLTTAQLETFGTDATSRAAVLNYLRGDASGEVQNGGTMRNRVRYQVGSVTGGVLGDIVNGSPIKGPDAGGGYEFLPASDAQDTYKAFRSGTKLDTMRKTIFVAANDGMLHGFNTDTGVERFAYVPAAVYTVPRSTAGGLAENKLKLLTDKNYEHRFTVDGPPNVADAYFNKNWHTVLVGSNGAGARGIFAIDVTNPDPLSTPDATLARMGTSNFLWEYSEADDSDMGFVLSYPHIVRLRNGQWAAIFGNGYDSANGQAKLYMIEIGTRKVHSFAVGAKNIGNGLSQPNFIVNAQREVIAIYAGDLKGNLWKFDVSSTDETRWKVAFNNDPLVTVTNSAGNVQPIAVMPEIVEHPSKVGAMLVFGTGKLFEASDTLDTDANVNSKTQSFYGIWDNSNIGGAEGSRIALTTGNRNTLLSGTQSPTYSGSQVFYETSPNAPDWTAGKRGWYLDLRTKGERANLTPQVIEKMVIMVANLPKTADPCENGGQSAIYFLNPQTGGKAPYPPFDSNNDGQITETDQSNVLVNSGGILSQPVAQLVSTTGTNPVNNEVTTAPTDFDRGQVSRLSGGVQLDKSLSETITWECKNGVAVIANKLIITAAQSDTSLVDLGLGSTAKPCPTEPEPETPPPTPSGPGRISWRQLQ